jgi:integrase
VIDRERIFSEQCPIFLEHIQKRKRRPVKPSTLAAYSITVKNWIVPLIGDQEIKTFVNGAMREFGQDLMARGLSPVSIKKITTLVKLIIASVVDGEGDQVYPRKWNAEFLDLPEITKQKSPMITKDQLIAALRSERSLLYALLAGTGLRIGEALALRCGNVADHSSLDLKEPVLHIKTAMWQRQEGLPKTETSVREVDLDLRLWKLLCESPSIKEGDFLFRGANGKPIWESSLRKFSLKPLGIQGFHTLRRFRTTHLRKARIQEQLIKYWLGHTSITDTTSGYDKSTEDVEFRHSSAQQAGLGFSLEKIACAPQPKPKPSPADRLIMHAALACVRGLVRIAKPAVKSKLAKPSLASRRAKARHKNRMLETLIKQSERDAQPAQAVCCDADLGLQHLLPECAESLR